MSDLIYVFDGGGRWALQLAATLLLAAIVLWGVFVYDGSEDDD